MCCLFTHSSRSDKPKTKATKFTKMACVIELSTIGSWILHGQCCAFLRALEGYLLRELHLLLAWYSASRLSERHSAAHDPLIVTNAREGDQDSVPSQDVHGNIHLPTANDQSSLDQQRESDDGWFLEFTGS